MWSSMSRWIARRSGRAPSTGSKPRWAIRALAAGVSSMPMSLSFSRISIWATIRSTIRSMSTWVSWRNTTISSTRLRNSGRKCCLSSSATLAFIFS